MNDKNFLTLTKVVGILWIIFGILTALTAVTLLFATGTVGYGANLARQLGRDVGSFPYDMAIMGGLSIAALAALYFVGAFALLKHKKWAYITVAAVAVVGLISNFILGGKASYVEIFWSIVYAVYAYFIYQKKNLFNK